MAQISERPAPVLLLTRELGLGGSERQLAETALALNRSLFEPHVGCFRRGGFRAGELERAGVPVLELGVASFLSGSAIAGARRFGRYVTRHEIRLVHAFDVPLNLFAVPIARFYRVPVVLSSQRAHRALTPGWRRHALRLTDHLVDRIVVNSRAVARELAEEEGVPRSLVRLAYNGIDIRAFRPEGPAAEPPWPDPCVVIGVICALRPEKGLPTLLDAFAHVLPGRPEARLLIVGSGPAGAELEAHARSLGLAAACHFQPAVANVAEWLRAIRIFVLPSLSEALSNSLMEAMACGCCAVASDTGGNPELVADGETGLLFPAGDAAALAERLDRLLRNPTLRRRLAEAGNRFIHGSFSMESAARRMGGIYAECLDSASIK